VTKPRLRRLRSARWRTTRLAPLEGRRRGQRTSCAGCAFLAPSAAHAATLLRQTRRGVYALPRVPRTANRRLAAMRRYRATFSRCQNRLLYAFAGVKGREGNKPLFTNMRLRLLLVPVSGTLNLAARFARTCWALTLIKQRQFSPSHAS